MLPQDLQQRSGARLPQQGFYDSGLGGLTTLPGAVYVDATLRPPTFDGVP